MLVFRQFQSKQNILQSKIDYSLNVENFDEFIYWKNINNSLPDIVPSIVDLSSDIITIGDANDL